MDSDDIIIGCLSDYVKVVTDSRNFRMFHDVAHLLPVYRGHADKDWPLLPSVFRSDRDFSNEAVFLKECLRDSPKEFSGLNYFEALVKAQHYGVPTRLLDFSYSPLIALYFACGGYGEKIEDKDGCVVVSSTNGLFFHSDYSVQAYMHYLFKFKTGMYWDRTSTERLMKSLEKEDTKFFISSINQIEEILQNPRVIFVSPAYSNERIRMQQGVIALLSTRLCYNVNQGEADKGHFLLPSEEMSTPLEHFQRIVIPRETKEQILYELELCGVSQEYLFPEFELHASHIVNKIRQARKGDSREKGESN